MTDVTNTEPENVGPESTEPEPQDVLALGGDNLIRALAMADGPARVRAVQRAEGDLRLIELSAMLALVDIGVGVTEALDKLADAATAALASLQGLPGTEVEPDATEPHTTPLIVEGDRIGSTVRDDFGDLVAGRVLEITFTEGEHYARIEWEDPHTNLPTLMPLRSIELAPTSKAGKAKGRKK